LSERHNLVRDAVKAFAAKVVHGNGGAKCEEWIQNPLPRKERLRADIRVLRGSVVSFIDVSISSPTIEAAVQTVTSPEPRTAAKITEQEKICKYREHYGDLFAETKVVPFVLESTGHWGSKATSFVDRLCKPATGNQIKKEVSDARQFLRQRIATLAMKGVFNLTVFGRNSNKNPPVNSQQ
jgi:hypothetical protein